MPGPTCPDELVALLDRAPDTETKKRLLSSRNTWLAEGDYAELVKLSAQDGIGWEEQHGSDLAVAVCYRDDGTIEVKNALAPSDKENPE